MTEITKSAEYNQWIKDIKDKIQKTQIKAAISVNRELIFLYWDLGKSISEKINKADWGTHIVENLSKELKKTFPFQKGFSRSNLFSMKMWYEFYAVVKNELEFVQQLVGQIPWGQNIIIASKSRNIDEAKFYLKKTIENGWSRAVLIHQIELDLFNRSAKAITNFDKTLPAPQSDLAKETLKDPYIFDFLNLKEKADERDIENQLVKHITSFLLELGAGFAFVGQQYKIAVDDTDFYIDLLFYHLKLKAYIVIELKVVEFKPEFAGKLNFYLSAVDDLVKSQDDNPSIGLILCKTKNKIQAEYALKDINKPLGIAEYRIGDAIPSELKSSLPSIEEIETELGGLIDNG